MPQAIAVPIREKIVKQHKKGKSLEAIAKQMEMSLWTVRKIWRRYRDSGEAGLETKYQQCGRSGIRSPELIYKEALKVRREHRKWGAGLIKVVLEQKWPQLHIPSERSLQKWFVAEGLNERKKKYLSQNRTRAQSVHQVWQMDATEQIELGDESKASWMTIADEKSGAILSTVIFPPGLLGEGRS
jgi:transposase